MVMGAMGVDKPKLSNATKVRRQDMTTGMLLFYGGFVLLALTIILAIIFALRPPKYTPENAAISAPGDLQTQPLKNNYSTNHQIIQQQSSIPNIPNAPITPATPGPAPSGAETAFLNPSGDTATALLDTRTLPLPQQAEHQDGPTALLPGGGKS